MYANGIALMIVKNRHRPICFVFVFNRLSGRTSATRYHTFPTRSPDDYRTQTPTRELRVPRTARRVRANADDNIDVSGAGHKLLLLRYRDAAAATTTTTTGRRRGKNRT